MGLEALAEMEYPGRVILVGRTETHNVVVYGITGRRPSSQSRYLDYIEPILVTMPTEPDAIDESKDPYLVYPSIITKNTGLILVSNGKHTSTLNEASKSISVPFEVVSDSNDAWSYELDPHYTPRISACVNRDVVAFGIIRKQKHRAEKNVFEHILRPGQGHFICTYEGTNSDPLPSFLGKPVEFDFKSSGEQFVSDVYAALGPKDGESDLRVGVAGFFVHRETKEISHYIINRHEVQ